MKLRFNRNLVVCIAGIICAVTFLVSLFTLIHYWEEKRNHIELPELNRDTITWQGTTYRQRDKLDTLLIMGLDKFDADQESGRYLNRQQSDFLLLLAVDRSNKSYSILQLNRDTMTDMYVLGERGQRVDRINGQLALAHTYGSGGTSSCRNTVETVSNLLHGVKIDHYLSLTMDAVGILNDFAGGVTVEIMDDFSSVSPDLVQGEVMTLNGQQALTYCRARGGLEDSSNLRRMERQRQYLQAFQSQVVKNQQDDPEFFAHAFAQVSDYLQSDLTGNQMSAISERMSEYTFEGFDVLEGKAVKGEKYMEFFPDEDSLMETVLRLYFEEQ